MQVALEREEFDRAAEAVPDALADLERVRDANLFGRAGGTFATSLVMGGSTLGAVEDPIHARVADRIDALLRAAPAGLDETARSDIFFGFAFYLAESAQLPDRALPVITRLADWRREHQSDGLADALLFQARCLGDLGRWSEVGAVLQEVDPMVGAMTPDLKVTYLEMAAMEASATSDRPRAVRLWREAAAAAELVSEHNQAAEYLLKTAAFEDDEDARLDFVRQALEATEGSTDPDARGNAALLIGLMLSERGEDAEPQLQRALALGIAALDPLLAARAVLMIAPLAPPERLLTYLILAIDKTQEIIERDMDLPEPLEDIVTVLVATVIEHAQRLEPGDRAVPLQMLYDTLLPEQADLMLLVEAAAAGFGIDLDKE